MYVCLYVCMYVCMRVCVYVCTYVCMYVCVCPYVCVCIMYVFDVFDAYNECPAWGDCVSAISGVLNATGRLRLFFTCFPCSKVLHKLLVQSMFDLVWRYVSGPHTALPLRHWKVLALESWIWNYIRTVYLSLTIPSEYNKIPWVQAKNCCIYVGSAKTRTLHVTEFYIKCENSWKEAPSD